MKKCFLSKLFLFFLVAVLCFFSNYLTSWLFNTILALNNKSQYIIMFLNIILKFLGCLILFFKLIGHNRSKEDSKFYIPKKNIVILLVILTCLMSFNIYHEGNVRLLFELQNYDLLYLVLRTLYNALYVLAMVLFIEYVDELILKAGKINKNIPYSGIVLGIIRSIPFIMTANYFMSLRIFVISVLFGLVYILLNRNRNFSYIIMLVMFYL